MRKNGFLEGTFVATFGIVMCKIIGIIYVIPFYSIIGKQGGALYSYAYSIYAIFLSLSSSGIPVAISKIVSEYHSLGFNYTKEKAYKIGKRMIITMGFISFIILLLFAETVAELIIGDINGGNTIESVTFVIRIVSTALLIFPLLSVSRGYLQGHKYIAASSISNIIEQISRVIVIIFGSFFALKVFNLSLEKSVGIAVFGATIGAICSYFYIYKKIKKSKINCNSEFIHREENISAKEIVKKIIFYALPFIVIDLVKSAYSMVDTFTVVKTMNNLGYTSIEAETTIGVMSTWASKLNNIIISIATGLTISLIPNVASSFIKNNFIDVSKKINQSLKFLIFMILPMTIGIFLLATPIWTIFYGYDPFSIHIFKLYIFQAISFSFFSVLIGISQTMNNTKLTISVLIISLILKILLNIPSMNVFHNLGIGAYYGPICVTIGIQLLVCIAILLVFNKKYKINIKLILNPLLKTLLSILGMIIVILFVKQFFINYSINKLTSIIEVTICFIIGTIVYLYLSYKSGLIVNIFEKNIIKILIDKIPLIKKYFK